MFQNKFAVQQAESTLALNTIQQMEQARTNDAKIAAYNLEMQDRQMRMTAFQKQQEILQRTEPLRLRAQEAELTAQIQQNTLAQIAPQFNDLRPEIAQTIFESPELADDIQAKYSETLARITQDSMNPEFDIISGVNQAKQELKSYVDKKKSQKQVKTAISESPIGRAASWLTNKLSNEPEEKSIDYGRAASAYAAFGGDPKEFARKNDPRIKEQISSAVRIAELTGSIEPSVLAELPQEDQERVLKSIESKRSQKMLIEQSKLIQDQVDSLRMLKEKDPANGARYDEAISEKLKEQNRVMGEFSRVGGTATPAPAPEPSPVDPITQKGAASTAMIVTDSPSATTKTREQLQFEEARDIAEGKIAKLRSLGLPISERIIGKKDKDGNTWSGGFLNPDQGFSSQSFSPSDFSNSDIENLMANDMFLNALESVIDEAYTSSTYGRYGVPNDEFKRIKDALITKKSNFDLEERKAIAKRVAFYAPEVLNRLASGN